MAWNAEVMVSGGNEGFIHVQARVAGDTQADALKGTEVILDSMASGKVAFVRARPEAHTDTDFDTKEVLHGGYVRFTFRNEPGNWVYPNDTPSKLPFDF